MKILELNNNKSKNFTERAQQLNGKDRGQLIDLKVDQQKSSNLNNREKKQQGEKWTKPQELMEQHQKVEQSCHWSPKREEKDWCRKYI